MNFKAIFEPLKDKKALKTFFLSIIIIAIIYISFSVILSIIAVKPLPNGSIIDVILYGGLRAFSTFNILDWIILSLFPLLGGLLFANYSYWKCENSKVGNTGLIAGLLAATCPACILPIIGITSFITFLTKITIYIKIIALLLLLGGTIYVANKNCKI